MDPSAAELDCAESMLLLQYGDLIPKIRAVATVGGRFVSRVGATYLGTHDSVLEALSVALGFLPVLRGLEGKPACVVAAVAKSYNVPPDQFHMALCTRMLAVPLAA